MRTVAFIVYYYISGSCAFSENLSNQNVSFIRHVLSLGFVYTVFVEMNLFFLKCHKNHLCLV